jgi:hypothetical protein
MFCWSSVLFWNGGKHSPRVNIDMWEYVGTLLHFKVKAVQHGMASQGIATQKIEFKAQLTSGKHHGKCRTSFRKNFMFIFFYKLSQCTVLYSNRLYIDMHKVIQMKRACKTVKDVWPYSRFDKDDNGISGLGNSEPSSFQWFLFVYAIEGAPRRTDILIWWWIQTWCHELAVTVPNFMELMIVKTYECFIKE